MTAANLGGEVPDRRHWRTVPSLLAAASQRPSGLKATEYTVLLKPPSEAISLGWAGSFKSKRTTRPCSPPAASSGRAGSRATAKTDKLDADRRG